MKSWAAQPVEDHAAWVTKGLMERRVRDFHCGSKSQRARILRLLIDARGSWVPLPEIMSCAAQYNARIFDLRHLGFNIENRTETIGEQRHSWFRLVNRPDPPAPEIPWQDRPRVATDNDGCPLVPADAGPLFAAVRQ